MGLFSGIGSFFGPVGGLIGGALDASQDEKASSYANRLAFDQQRTLRQTAYQDTVGDLKSAGLNPMLAYSNGATQGGASPPVANTRLAAAQTNSANSSASVQKAQVENVQADTALKNAQAMQTESQTHMNTASTGQIQQNTENLKAELPNIKQKIANMQQEINASMTGQRKDVDLASLAVAQAELARMTKSVEEGRIGLVDAQKNLAAINARLQDLEVNKGKAYSDYYNTPAGKSEPYVGLADKSVGVVTGGIGKVIKSMKGSK